MHQILTKLLSMRSEHDPESEKGQERDAAIGIAEPVVKPPSMYKVLMMNDDYTPMEFVVEILQGFFAMSRDKAGMVMLEVHTKGKAVCGVYSKDVAETKAAQVNEYALNQGHPLKCMVERA